MQISDATFVVTDTETTGTRPASDRVIELAAVKVRGGEVVDRFQELINPGRSIPKRITQITGITTGMVYDAPSIEKVLPDYLDFLGDGIFTAHNLSFDLNFLNAECRRCDAPELGNDTLCTLRLARRLLPGLKSKGLSRLIQFYDLQVNGRHRALGDAEATATILRQFFSQLAFEHQIETVDALLTFQHRRYQKVRRVPNHLKRLRREMLPAVPDRPGVYFFKNSSGSILYIGKAKRLASRVRSYFNAIESHAPQRRKLMQRVRTVDWTTTATELEALLLESRLIKKHKPSYNRVQRHYYNRPFLRLDAGAHVPRLSWTTVINGDDAEYFGPLRSRKQAEMILEVVNRFYQLRECDDEQLQRGERCLYADLERCTAPCEGDAGAYAEAVERVRRFLLGQDRSVLDALKARMEQSAAQLEFEQAATFRDWHDEVEHLLDRQEAVAAPVLEHHVVLVHPGPEGRREVFFVRHGRLVETHCLGPRRSEPALQALRTAIAEVFSPEHPRPNGFSQRDVDEIRLLAQWMYAHRDAIVQVRWHPEESPETLAHRVIERIRRPAAADATSGDYVGS